MRALALAVLLLTLIPVSGRADDAAASRAEAAAARAEAAATRSEAAAARTEAAIERLERLIADLERRTEPRRRAAPAPRGR
jgi:hypothetical protein